MGTHSQKQSAARPRSVLYSDDLWTVYEINTREEAVELGRPQWCTGKACNPHWEFYKPEIGRLLVFYRAGKRRPQYQMFYSHHRALEFRDGGNMPARLDLAVPSYVADHVIEYCSSRVKPVQEPELNPFVADLSVGIVGPVGTQGPLGISLIHAATLAELEQLQASVGHAAFVAELQQVYAYTGEGWTLMAASPGQNSPVERGDGREFQRLNRQQTQEASWKQPSKFFRSLLMRCAPTSPLTGLLETPRKLISNWKTRLSSSVQ